MTPPDKNNISLLSVSTDRPSHRYAAGEKVSFRITAKQNGTADVKILTDGRRILHLQQLKLQAASLPNKRGSSPAQSLTEIVIPSPYTSSKEAITRPQPAVC